MSSTFYLHTEENDKINAIVKRNFVKDSVNGGSRHFYTLDIEVDSERGKHQISIFADELKLLGQAVDSLSRSLEALEYEGMEVVHEHGKVEDVQS